MSSVYTSINQLSYLPCNAARKNEFNKRIVLCVRNHANYLTIQNYSCSLVQVIKLLLCNFINRKEANDQFKNNNNEKKVLSADQI